MFNLRRLHIAFERPLRNHWWAVVSVAVLTLAAVPLNRAFGQSQTASQAGARQFSGQASGQTPGQAAGQNQQPQTTPDSGGPGADSGTIAIPKKNPDDQPPPAPGAAGPSSNSRRARPTTQCTSPCRR